MTDENNFHSDAERAEVLFGETSKPEPNPDTVSRFRQRQISETDPAERMFGKEPDKSEDVFERHHENQEASQKDEARTKAQADTKDHQAEADEVEANVAKAEEIINELDLDPDDALTPEFAAYAASHKLDPEAAQEMVELHHKHNHQQWEKLNETWRRQSVEEFQDQDALSGARQLITKYGDEDLDVILDEYGFGNHPAVIRFLTKLAGNQGRR